MDSLPPEVLRIICKKLQFQDAANVRFLNRTLSVIAAEYLLTRVRFHASHASLERLKAISEHPIFNRTVKTLVFEAALLANITSRDEYAGHFRLDHHGLERPDQPPPTCSDREHRLYQRNMTKWTHDIYAKYDSYRVLFNAQKSLLENNILETTLSQCVLRFSKLEAIDVDPVRRCAHMTSKRFIEEFGSDCVRPFGGTFSRVTSQFKSMFLPHNSVIRSLRKLDINSLSPTFFGEGQRDIMKLAFSSLTVINLTLTISDKDLKGNELFKDAFHRHLANGIFRDALASAEHLVSVNIGTQTPHLFYVEFSDIFPQTTWKKLTTFGLSTLTGTQDDFIDLMKRQPKLKHVEITDMQLTEGTWPDTLQKMRDNLDLSTFFPIGFLGDSQESWPMDLISMPAYRDGFSEIELSDMINDYVVDHDLDASNPLINCWDEYEDADMVRDMYGHLSDLDEMSIGNSDMAEDMSEDLFDSDDDPSDIPMLDL